MHPALEVEEILLNIFGHCRGRSDLAALARTCRTFKESALDILWEELDNTFPLGQWFPEICPENRITPPRWLSEIVLSERNGDKKVSLARRSLNRPLAQTDWGVVHSYTRRIRTIHDFDGRCEEPGLCSDSEPPSERLGPLFPNLRHLCCDYQVKTVNLLCHPLPSLISLDITYHSPALFHDSLDTFLALFPSVRALSIDTVPLWSSERKFPTNYICPWRNLQSLDCPFVVLNVDTFVDLSHMPALAALTFSLDTAWPERITPPDSPLFFSTLRTFKIRCTSLDLIRRLLLQVRLPVIKTFSASIDVAPFELDLRTFFTAVHTSFADCSIEEFTLDQRYVNNGGSTTNRRREDALLGLEDLQSCKTFGKLRSMDLNVAWEVGLTDSDLLALAASWPRLQRLTINRDWGWNRRSGITPHGLVRLLQMCPLLAHVAIALDTRGHTKSTPLLARLGLALPSKFSFNVLDSLVEKESKSVAGVFFACIETFCVVTITCWDGHGMMRPRNSVEESGKRRLKEAIESASIGNSTSRLFVL